MSDNKENTITEVISSLMDKVMDGVLVSDPFIKGKHHSGKPLYVALVPDEIFKGNHFERRFVTSFGRVWEKLATAVALQFHGHCESQKMIRGTIREERLRRIQEVLNKLVRKEKGKEAEKPNWSTELSYILKGRGDLTPTNVLCDLFIESQKTKKRYAFEIQAPFSNNDQTKESKEKLFKLLAMEETCVDFVYFALPYNLYRENEDNSGSFTMRCFDKHKDESVLIGDEFWELIGGKGTYNKFISAVNSIAVEYKERIYREFLNIKPPEHTEGAILQ